MTLTPARYLDHLERDAASFSALLADGDLAAPVPACPGWDVLDLTAHVGSIHRWARDAVVEGRPTNEERPHPRDRNGLRSWFDEGAAELLVTLRGTDPAGPCWHFGPKPRRAEFWFRRQAHETAMHVRDVEEAVRGAAAPLHPELVPDGIEEVLAMFLPRQVRLGRLDPSFGVVELRPTDTGTGPFRLAPAEDGEVVGIVAGPAETLLLLLWRRLSLEAAGVRVQGDGEAVTSLFALPITP
jgi:uncharacterized protein (TIGR03083 family)